MASAKHVHSMTSSVTYSRAHKKKPIRRRRRSTYSTSSEDMGDPPQTADPRTVRAGRLRYYREAEDRRRREERDRVGDGHRRNSDAQRTRSQDERASSQTGSRESHNHHRSSNARNSRKTPPHDNDRGKRRQDSLERVVIRRTIVEEPRGSFIAGHLKELRSPVVRRTSPRLSEAGPSHRGTHSNYVRRSTSVQERSDRNVAAAASIAESARRRDPATTRDRPARDRSLRSPGKEEVVSAEDSETVVASPSVARSVITQTTTNTKRRGSKPPPSVLGTIFGAPTPAAKQPEALLVHSLLTPNSKSLQPPISTRY